MWLKNEVFLGMLLTLLVNHRVSGQEDYGSCVNPRNQQGRCRNIRECEPLLNLLRAYGNAAGQFLRDSVCVYENGDPIVCCPYTDDPPVPTKPVTNKPVVSSQRPNQNGYGPLLSPVCGWTNAKYTRVVAGVPATLGTWPWAALLGYRSQKNPNKPRWLCGGSLISARHVLTAGHCIYNRNDLYLVRLGELDIDNDNDGATPIDLLIDRITLHPQYSPTAYTSDIAVIRLERDVQFTDLIKPICLPVTQDIQRKDLSNAYPFVVGWGSVYHNGPTASKLQQVQLPLRSESECRAAYTGKGATIDGRVLCAGYAKGGKDACQGDSGGPLMYPIGQTWYSIGVVSYGFKCALPGFPGVYSKTQAFLDFILSTLN